MRISEIRIRNYRNFVKTKILLSQNDSVVLGENGSGKTNLFRAIRLVLDNKYNVTIKQDDFSVNICYPKANWIIIQVKFIEVDTSELGAFGVKINPNDVGEAWINFFYRPVLEVRQNIVSYAKDKNADKLREYLSGLDSKTDYEIVRTLGEIPDYTQDSEYFQLVGDLENLEMVEVTEYEDTTMIGNSNRAMDVIRNMNIITIPAGRDPFEEMTGSSGIIKSIVAKKQSSISKEKLSVLRENLARVSQTIENLEEFQSIADHINEAFKETLGDINAKKANVSSLISDEINDLFKYIGLNIEDDKSKLPLYYRSLGEQSILHLVLRMIHSESSEKTKFTLLLVEEPEVHLHTHLQRTLFINLQRKRNMQLILSTHSSNISYSTSISKMIILNNSDNNTDVFYPSKGLLKDQIIKTERYLDANRTPLLFAKSVLLVEGDAEAIILPWLFKKHYNHTLDEYTISLIKVDSTFFKPISQLFDRERINRMCYIITDRDKDYTKNKEHVEADKLGRLRMAEIFNLKKSNPYIVPSFAQHTFEIQLYAKNIDILKGMLDSKLIYQSPPKIEEIKSLLDSDKKENVFSAIMKCVSYAKKGWMALYFIEYCENNLITPKIPLYIKKIFNKVVS